jgi:tetratricopeptide (TPR) repeat protein
VIGPYKLLEQIGEGGMGTVWMAQQTEPVKRVVALKLIKAGMDSRQVIARFEAERQALALMDHPNIARVLDGGTTSAGRPYFVMELVKGVPLTRYCDEHRLTPKQRLELFIPVCQAVQHAHQKGIIHRDLKPSNVLVALYDGKPVPKVIDFGVAKAAGQALTEKTLVTGIGNIVGTLEYMSPEQAEINQLDIDTRSDVYALGVLLYELLAGSPPFSRKELEKAGVLEMLRVIREQEPSKPSTKLSTAEGLPTLAANRGTEPAKLTRLVRGELDWIVMKALEKDRNRRYETANGFAMDVQRYLADEPVQACPPSAWYRFRKFARRNKGRLAAVAGVFLAVTLMAATVGWAVRDRAAREAEVKRQEEKRQEGVAQQAARALLEAQNLCRADRLPEAKAAVKLAEELLAGGGSDELHGRLSGVRRDIDMAGRMEETRLHRTDAIKDNGFDNAEADRAYGEIFRDYGLDIAVLAPDQAAEQIRASAIREQLMSGLDDWLYVKARVDATGYERLLAVVQRADTNAWRSQLRDACRHRDWKTVLELAGDPKVIHQRAATLFLLEYALTEVGERPKTIALLRSAQQQYPNDFRINHELAMHLMASKQGKASPAVGYLRAALVLRPESPLVWGNLGAALDANGELAEAVAAYSRAIELDPKFAQAWSQRGWERSELGQYDKAVADCSRAIELSPKLRSAWHIRGIAYNNLGQPGKAVADHSRAIELEPKFADAWTSRGNDYFKLGLYDKALADHSKAIDLDPKLARAWSNRGSVYCDGLHQPEKALADFSRAIELDPEFRNAWFNRGNAYWKLRQYDKAVADYTRAIELDSKLVPAWRLRGVAYCDHLGQPEKAVADFTRVLELVRTNVIDLLNRGIAYRRSGHYEKAIADYSRTIELDPKYLSAWCDRSLTYSHLGQYDRAAADLEKAIELDPKHAGAHNSLAWLLATCPDAKLRDPGRAVELARKAVLLAPNDKNNWGTLGAAQYRAGDWKAAVATLEKARELSGGGDAYDWLFLAMAHRKLGNADESLMAYDRAIEWLEKNKAMLEKDKNQAEELRRFRSEAEDVLELKK